MSNVQDILTHVSDVRWTEGRLIGSDADLAETVGDVLKKGGVYSARVEGLKSPSVPDIAGATSPLTIRPKFGVARPSKGRRQDSELVAEAKVVVWRLNLPAGHLVELRHS